MATIYRYILETREGGGTSGRKNNNAPKKATGKGKWLGGVGPKGGVEHNRRMRAINPLINRATHGYWEQGMRLGRAGMGLARNVSEKGFKSAFVGPAIAIIIAWVIQTLFKWQRKQMDIANKQNTQNYKSMENGVSQIHGEYQVTRNWWNGKVSYNENK